MPAPRESPITRVPHRAGYLLGFSLGGFFDGILLHQILQWHHLLSLVEGVGDIHRQLFFDGLFHALMYVIAIAGLILLWRGGGVAGAGRFRLLGDLLIGFGAWHVVDALLSHWILGIHRIRLDSTNPLLWDLGWLAAFGLVPISVGVLLRRPGRPHGGGGRGALISITLAVVLAGAWAARPPAETDRALVLFLPGTSDGEAWNAIAAAGGNVLGRSRGLWAVQWREDARPTRLFGRGALVVSGVMIGGGCAAWARP